MSPQEALNQIQKEQADTQKKLENVAPEPQPDRGEAKGAEPKGGEAKCGPGGGDDGPEPQAKDQPPMQPGDAGDSKGQGGQGSGQARDPGEKKKNGNEPQGAAKGVEEQGPGQQGAKSNGPPELQPKGGMGNDAGSAKSEPKDGPNGQARGDDGKMNPKQPTLNDIAKKIDQLLGNGPDAEAAKALVAIAQNADDSRKSEIAADALVAAGRDPINGKKAPNPYGSGSKSSGISDELKAAAAKREFTARIGQMQLDDWQKRLTPELMKKAGISEAEWERYIKNTRAYDAHVRALNAQIARQALKKSAGPTAPGVGVRVIEGDGTSNEARGGTAPPPPELRDPQREFSQPRNP